MREREPEDCIRIGTPDHPVSAGVRGNNRDTGEGRMTIAGNNRRGHARAWFDAEQHPTEDMTRRSRTV